MATTAALSVGVFFDHDAHIGIGVTSGGLVNIALTPRSTEAMSKIITEAQNVGDVHWSGGAFHVATKAAHITIFPPR